MKIKQVPQLLLYCTLFLFRIPNLYILPFIHNSFLTTQAFGRILLVLFILCAIYFRKNKAISSWSVENVLVVSLLFVQSLSVVSALNISAFLMRYKDIVIAAMLFLTLKEIRVDLRIIMRIIIITAVVNSLYAIAVIYFPSIHSLFSAITYERYFNLVLSDIERGRYYATSYDEVIVPLLFSEGKFFLAALVSGITLVANFRTKILSLFFVCISYLLLKDERIKNNLLKVFFGIIIVGVISATFSISNENYLERLNIGEGDQIETITSRADQIASGFYLGKMPLGVGLGNYYDYVPTRNKRNIVSTKNEQVRMREVHDSIHNNFASILAESGYLAFFIYTALILHFLWRDILCIVNQKSKHKNVFILMFWGLFIYGFLNPGVALSYQFQYWFYRGLISNESID